MANNTRDTLQDLNSYLFMEIERLSDEELTGDELDKELQRAKGITSVAERIIGNANVVMESVKLSLEYGVRRDNLPRMLIGRDGQ